MYSVRAALTELRVVTLLGALHSHRMGYCGSDNKIMDSIDNRFHVNSDVRARKSCNYDECAGGTARCCESSNAVVNVPIIVLLDLQPPCELL